MLPEVPLRLLLLELLRLHPRLQGGLPRTALTPARLGPLLLPPPNSRALLLPLPPPKGLRKQLRWRRPRRQRGHSRPG